MRKTAEMRGKKRQDDKTPGRNQKLGETGEFTACRYLETQGYRILERNFRCRSGEIDIVAAEEGADGPVLVFVEVKTRRNLAYGTPALSVTAEKQRHLLTAASLYRKGAGLFGVNCRYDVIEILYRDETAYVHHIRNAFS